MADPMPVQDVLALLNLQAEYAEGADSFSGAAYASVFTEDGVLDATHTGRRPGHRAVLLLPAQHPAQRRPHRVLRPVRG